MQARYSELFGPGMSFYVCQLRDTSFYAFQLRDIGFYVFQIQDTSFYVFQLRDVSFYVFQLRDINKKLKLGPPSKSGSKTALRRPFRHVQAFRQIICIFVARPRLNKKLNKHSVNTSF